MVCLQSLLRDSRKAVDKRREFGYNNSATKYASIAQEAERILGKDEVTSSNLVRCSKTLDISGHQMYQGFFYVRRLCAAVPVPVCSLWNCYCFKKMPEQNSTLWL